MVLFGVKWSSNIVHFILFFHVFHFKSLKVIIKPKIVMEMKLCHNQCVRYQSRAIFYYKLQVA